MKEMTETEVINILENCIKRRCEYCFQFVMYEDDKDCMRRAMENALDLINRKDQKTAELETQNNDLFYKLSGVMLSVDKWLEGKELKQDEVNRAITMREKTLQIVEKREAEVERLKNFIEKDQGLILKLTGVPVDEYNNKIKSEAYREFAGVVLRRIGFFEHPNAVVRGHINNTLKELTESNE